MRTALAWARRGAGRTWPNPSVGAVVFRGDRELGCGRTRPPGGPHAEVVALRAAARRHGERSVRGASLAVTLEPCCFEGRTGPCTEAIVAAGIRRIVVGCRDPHPRVDGRGLRALARAGLDVELGVLEAACIEHHRGFFSLCQRGRPHVTLKLATTLDGRIATARGESRWITSPAARRFVHRMRARVDAVMVGAGTGLADDPALTARRGDHVLARPARILVDARLRVPTTSRLYADDGAPVIVLCRRGVSGRRAVGRTGARVVEVGGRGAHLDLAEALTRLGDIGLTTVFVEGGGGLAAALLRAERVDEIHWIVAPKVLGGDAVSALGPLGVEALAAAPALSWESVGRLGPDLHLRATPSPCAAGSLRGRARRQR